MPCVRPEMELLVVLPCPGSGDMVLLEAHVVSEVVQGFRASLRNRNMVWPRAPESLGLFSCF